MKVILWRNHEPDCLVHIAWDGTWRYHFGCDAGMLDPQDTEDYATCLDCIAEASRRVGGHATDRPLRGP